MPKGYMYILKCADDSYYTGNTVDLLGRLKEHQAGEGAKEQHENKVRFYLALPGRQVCFS